MISNLKDWAKDERVCIESVSSHKDIVEIDWVSNLLDFKDRLPSPFGIQLQIDPLFLEASS